MLKELNEVGYILTKNIYSESEVETILNILREGGITGHGKRDLIKKCPGLIEKLLNDHLKAIHNELNLSGFLSKALYFDKPSDANWYVKWHQDATINVKERIDLPGFYGWTSKENNVGVCPPQEILDSIFTFRIHLDDTNESNGALKVIPGTHKQRLGAEEVPLLVQESEPAICNAEKGDILLMKPMLLHASGKNQSSGHRRIIHLEFADCELPGGLEWAEKLPLA